MTLCDLSEIWRERSITKMSVGWKSGTVTASADSGGVDPLITGSEWVEGVH